MVGRGSSTNRLSVVSTGPPNALGRASVAKYAMSRRATEQGTAFEGLGVVSDRFATVSLTFPPHEFRRVVAARRTNTERPTALDLLALTMRRAIHVSLSTISVRLRS